MENESNKLFAVTPYDTIVQLTEEVKQLKARVEELEWSVPPRNV